MDFIENKESTSDLYYDIIEGNIELKNILKNKEDIEECNKALDVIRILIDEIINKQAVEIL